MPGPMEDNRETIGDALMWTVAGLFMAGCLGALISGLVIVAASWRQMMEQWDDE